MSTHTKGPWRDVSDHKRGRASSRPMALVSTTHLTGVCIDCTGSGASFAEDCANAALIAAAPDLLEALRTVLDSMGALTKQHELENHMRPEEAAQVWAALAKAEGA
jgi:hypothetical protein